MRRSGHRRSPAVAPRAAASSRSSSAISGVEVAQPDRRRRPRRGASSIGGVGRGAGVVARRRGTPRAGARPMSSDSARSTPSSAASSPTVSQTRQSGVVPEVEQVHRDLGADRMPALRLLDPEAVRLDARQAAAGLADAPRDPLRELDVVRVEVDVLGDEERPRADRDRAGPRVHPGRPEVGLRGRCWPISALRPSYWPRRTSASLTRSGARRRLRVEVDREVRTRRRSARRTPRASSTQSSIVVSPSGTNGMTSTAPIRGCSPVCSSMSISWMRAAPRARSSAVGDGVVLARRG